MNQEVNVLAIVKGNERYVFMYNEKNRDQIIETFARYASDSQLSFSWYDAALLTQRVRLEQRQSEIAAARAANAQVRQTAPESRARCQNTLNGLTFGHYDELGD